MMVYNLNYKIKILNKSWFTVPPHDTETLTPLALAAYLRQLGAWLGESYIPSI